MAEVRRQEVIQSAEQLVRRGRLEAAIDEYRKVLRQEPDDTRTLNRVGDLFLRLGRVEESIDLFRRAAEHFSREGFFVKAIAIFKKVIRVDPTRIEAYEELADLYGRQGLLNEARAQYQVVADYFGQQGHRPAQLKVFRKMAELDPGDAALRLRLAEAYLEDGRPHDAMEQYRNIAGLLLDHQRGEDAARVLRRAIEINPHDLGFLTDAVLELKGRGHMEIARAMVDAAISVNPEAERVRGLAGLTEGEGPPPAAEAGPVAAPSEEPEPAASVETAAVEPAAEPGEESDSAVLFLDIDDPANAVPDSATFEFEIGLEELEAPAAGEAQTAAESEPPPAEAPAPAAEITEPAAAMEPPVEAPVAPGDGPEPAGFPDAALEEYSGETPDATEQVLELMAEAQVLTSYGLDEKAVQRFEQVLELRPDHLEAHARLAEIHLHAGEVGALAATIARAAAAVPEEAQPHTWSKIRELLAGEGYRLVGGQVVAPGESAAEVAGEAAAGEPEADAPPFWLVEDEAAEPADLEMPPVEGDLDVQAVAPQWLEETFEAEPQVSPAADDAPRELAFDEPEIDAALSGIEGQAPLGETPEGRPVPAEPPALPEQPTETAAEAAAEVEAPAVEVEPPAAEVEAPEADIEAPEAEIEAPAVDEAPISLEELAADAATVEPPQAIDAPVVESSDAPGAVPGWPAEDAVPAPRPEIPPPPMEPGTGAEGVAEESAIRWLDELAADSGAREAGDRMFGQEAEFFDLAAELEEELREEEERLGEPIAPPAVEQSLEEIVQGFKDGVAATLAKEDYDTHYNLGVAYREMGLIDEAIGEFQLAAKDPRYLVDCCSLLGACFLEKGFSDLAVKWYRRGLDSPAITEDETLGLLYELGNLHLALGDPDEARETFIEIYGINSNYRDVVARLEELRVDE